MKVNVQHILITLGGADMTSNVRNIVAALDEVPGNFQIRCIMGSLAEKTHIHSLAHGRKHTIHLLSGVRDMTEHMNWADLSINAAGSTTWELCAMGVPMILIVLADNQREIALQLDQMGCAMTAGDWDEQRTAERIVNMVNILRSDAGRRSEMVSRARKLVDGKGAERVVQKMMIISSRREKAA